MKNQGKDKKVALIIMDGWGKELDKSRSAIAKAHTPNVDSFYNDYPNSTLVTYGEQVGLPAGQMGNSEVGHMNLGAGRIVYQELQRINKAIEDKSLAQNLVLQKMFHYAKNNDKTLHLMGLVSDGGVHSHIRHIEALCQYAANFGLQKIYIHAFTDGRDCAPESGLGLLTDLEKNILNTPAKISTIIGRYYAMDRDKRWNRIKLAYDLMLKGQGEVFSTTKEAIQSSYDSDITDEFITPKVIDKNGMIQEGDAVLCFNFRTDRCREITTVFTQQNMPDEGMTTLPLHYVTMTRYDNRFKNVNVMLEKDDLKNTLGEILAKNGKTQLRIAETEKYPHVTFFFSGGREKPFNGENRIVCASPKVATYDLQPEMSAKEITNNVINEINTKSPDFICLNFANTDMVGHTGIMEAAIKAAETVDTCVKQVIDTALEKDYTILLTADHGNADIMQNEDDSPHTAHTKNLVPLFLIDKKGNHSLQNGKLGDIAPTILTLMGLDIPNEMDGGVLI